MRSLLSTLEWLMGRRGVAMKDEVKRQGTHEHRSDQAYIIVKAAPRSSRKFGETVCIAGIDRGAVGNRFPGRLQLCVSPLGHCPPPAAELNPNYHSWPAPSIRPPRPPRSSPTASCCASCGRVLRSPRARKGLQCTSRDPAIWSPVGTCGTKQCAL